MPPLLKKEPRGFSLTNEEMALVLERTKFHGFKNRNEYVLALVEADTALAMEVGLNAEKQKILRPSPNPQLTKAVAKLKESSPPFNRRAS